VATLAIRFESGVDPALHCCFGSTTNPDEFAVLGTTGRLISRPLDGSDVLIEHSREQQIDHHPRAEMFNSPLIAAFTATILKSQNPAVSGEDRGEVSRIMERDYTSA